MSKLKRCPFCGGEAKIDKTITNTVSVECTVCHASSRIILCTEGDIEQKAIKAWNIRKPLERIVERLEEEHGTVIYENGVIVGYDKGFVHIDEAIEIVREEGGLNG